jgi:hypothetical protein
MTVIFQSRLPYFLLVAWVLSLSLLRLSFPVQSNSSQSIWALFWIQVLTFFCQTPHTFSHYFTLDSGNTSTKSKIISDAVVGVTCLVTGLAMWYIVRKMNEAKPAVIYDKRKARLVFMQPSDALSSYRVLQPSQTCTSRLHALRKCRRKQFNEYYWLQSSLL